MENKIDSNVNTRSTSTLVSSDVEIIWRDDLDSYYRQVTGQRLYDYLYNDLSGGINDMIIEAIGKKFKPKLMNVYELIFTMSDIVAAIDEAMTAYKLGQAIYNVYNRGGRALRIQVSNYEWLSGSGNHTSYYSTISYSVIM